MATYRSVIDIEAPPERVWEVLADVERWPEWTASVQRVELLDGGPLTVGSRVRIKQPRFPTVAWTVTAMTPGESFSWEARSPGLVSTGVHDVRRIGDSATQVTLRLDQQGWAAGVMGRLTGGLTQRYVETEAAGLKRRSEGG